MRTLQALVLLVIGCEVVAPVSTPPKPAQETALAMAFELMGGAPRDIPISWVEGAGLNCHPADQLGAPVMVEPGMGTGFYEPSNEKCVLGVVQLDWRNRVVRFDLAWTSWMRTVADSSLLHEVCHVVKGDFDHQSWCDDFGPYLVSRTVLMHEAFPAPPDSN